MDTLTLSRAQRQQADLDRRRVLAESPHDHAERTARRTLFFAARCERPVGARPAVELPAESAHR